MVAKKKMKQCLKLFAAGGKVNVSRAKKLCKKMTRLASAIPPGKPHARIKSCKKSDAAVRRIIGSLAWLKHSASQGDGSGAEDRHHYYAEDVKQALRSHCGPKFVKSVMKSVRKIAY